LEIRNPSSLVSGPFSLRLNSNPSITSINSGNPILNTFAGQVNVNGNDFDPVDLTLNYEGSSEVISLDQFGIFNDLVSSINPNSFLLQVLPGLPAGNWGIRVVNRDGVLSSLSSLNPPTTYLVIHHVFNYINRISSSYLGQNLKIRSVVTGTTFTEKIIIEHGYWPYVTEEVVTVTANSNNVLPTTSAQTCGTTLNPFLTDLSYSDRRYCELDFSFQANNIVGGTHYNLVFTSTSPTTADKTVTRVLRGTLGNLVLCQNNQIDPQNGETDIDCGGPTCPACSANRLCDFDTDCATGLICALETSSASHTCQGDDDGDGVANNIDQCSGTQAGAALSIAMPGCPIPVHSFSNTLSTPFSNVPNLNAVSDMILAEDGIGAIEFLDPVSVLTSAFQPVNLDDAITIVNTPLHLIGVDSVNYPLFDVSAQLVFYNINSPTTNPPITDITPTVSDGSGNFVTCPNSVCESVSFANNEYIVNVDGFSDYGYQQATCGDGYCSLGESQSSCPGDCGVANPAGSSGGSSGGGSGSGRSSGSGKPPIVRAQCDDDIDNDGDGLIDFPADPGCFTLQDTFEVESNPLIDDGDEGVLDTGGSLEKIFEIRVVFWIVLLALIGGIVVVSTVILRDLMEKKKFNKLASMVNLSQSTT